MAQSKITVVSMQSPTKGFDNLPKDTRNTYLHKLMNEIKPDIVILPGDHMKTIAFLNGYGQYIAPNNKGTLMLYNVEKVKMSTQSIGGNVFKNLQRLDQNKIAWPEVKVIGNNQVINTFTIVSFDYKMFSTSNLDANKELMRNLALFSQRVAIATGNPVMIDGDIKLPYDTTRSVVTETTTDFEQALRRDPNALLSSFDYSPAMVKPSTSDRESLTDLYTIGYKMKREVFARSRPQPIWADCIILSRALQVSGSEALDIEGILGHKIKFTFIDDSHSVQWKHDFSTSLPENECSCCIL